MKEVKEDVSVLKEDMKEVKETLKDKVEYKEFSVLSKKLAV